MHQTVLQALAASEMFAGAPRAALEVLAARAAPQALTPNQVVFLRGSPGDAMYAVLSGRVRIVGVSEQGHEVTLNLFSPGEVFGEIAVIDAGPRSADAYAHGQTRVGRLAREDVLRFLAENPESCLQLLQMVCQRLRRTTEQVEAIAFELTEVRLARLLLDLGDRYGVPTEDGVQIAVKLSQREIGAFIAATREIVSTQLTRWRDRGLIGRRDGRIVLLSLKELQTVAKRRDDEA